MAIKIKRIEKEFTFKTLITNSTRIKIHGKNREITCKLLKYTEDSLEIDTLEEDVNHLKKGDEIRAYFLFQNNRHTFETKVLRIEENKIVIKQPSGLYKNLKREYERIKADSHVKVNFKLKEKRIELNFPKTENYFPLNEFDLPDNLDYSNMQYLIKDFRKKLQYKVSDNQIIMLRNKAPTTYEEKLMARTGKIIWFPRIDEGLIDQPVLPEEILFKQQDFRFYEEQNGLLSGEIDEKFSRLQKGKLNKGFFSQLYCPVLFNEYFIGYIYLANRIERNQSIGLETVKFVYEFARVLCYSLKVNHYFKAREREISEYEVPIIDISASGLLFAHWEKRLPKELLLHTPINITININNRKLHLESRVMRKFRDLRFCYFGLHFTQIEPEDFRFLFEYIYGKEYIQSCDTLWDEMNEGESAFEG